MWPRWILSLVFFLCSLPLAALELTAEACHDIKAKYGAAPQECDALGLVKNWDGPDELGQSIRENHIFFAKGGVALDSQARDQIAQLVRVLDTPLMRNTCLELVGHSDTSGSELANYRLSLRRAEAVQSEINKYLGTGATEVAGKGEEAPLRALKSTSPWQRRVEIRARRCP